LGGGLKPIAMITGWGGRVTGSEIWQHGLNSSKCRRLEIASWKWYYVNAIIKLDNILCEELSK